jgi:phage tail protein X
MIYRTKEGDVLDQLCARHYGDEPYRVEDVLAANPGLAAHGPVVAPGLLITLPAVDDTAKERPTIRLWD